MPPLCARIIRLVLYAVLATLGVVAIDGSWRRTDLHDKLIVGVAILNAAVVAILRSKFLQSVASRRAGGYWGRGGGAGMSLSTPSSVDAVPSVLVPHGRVAQAVGVDDGLMASTRQRPVVSSSSLSSASFSHHYPQQHPPPSSSCCASPNAVVVTAPSPFLRSKRASIPLVMEWRFWAFRALPSSIALWIAFIIFMSHAGGCCCLSDDLLDAACDAATLLRDEIALRAPLYRRRHPAHRHGATGAEIIRHESVAALMNRRGRRSDVMVAAHRGNNNNNKKAMFTASTETPSSAANPTGVESGVDDFFKLPQVVEPSVVLCTGSLLAALRHHGHPMPWEHDIDLCVNTTDLDVFEAMLRDIAAAHPNVLQFEPMSDDKMMRMLIVSRGEFRARLATLWIDVYWTSKDSLERLELTTFCQRADFFMARKELRDAWLLQWYGEGWRVPILPPPSSVKGMLCRLWNDCPVTNLTQWGQP